MRPRHRSPLGTLAVLAALVLAAASPLTGAWAQLAPKVAYVYDTDTVSRDSFVATLELRGLDVVPLNLADAETHGDVFSSYLAVIIADDTGATPTGPAPAWEGGPGAQRDITNFAQKIISIGYGAQFFDSLGLGIGEVRSTPGSQSGVFAVEPGAAYWSTPNAVPVPADNVVKLYNLTTPMLAVTSPLSPTVTPIGREPAGQGGYPLAAQQGSNQVTQQLCSIQWGFRRAPNAMTAAGRDLLENIVRGNPCATQARPADVGITKTGKPDQAVVGQNLTYTLTVSNAGPAPAPNVRVEDTLPESATFVSATPSQGSCIRTGRTVRCSLGTLAAGGSATVTIVVRPSEATTLTNTAAANSGAPDPNQQNNSAAANTAVNQPPTFTPLLALPYKPFFEGPLVLLPTEDLSIHGIEITQGIQCFDTSQGLSDCSNNSLPQVTKKSTAARIYLRYSGPGSGKNNVPVRLIITDANNVVYPVNVTGRALPTISRGNAADSANVFFVVNFTNPTAVKFHAIVDPNGTIAETNETNNRFPASGDVIISFSPRRTMKIVGERLDYHPSGYSGTRQAGGWAVNGGAAQWLEQLLPVRNGGITYQVKSGYLDWTTTLPGSSSGQHALIGNLNARWILQNVFFWLFGSGAFTGARHVYGWAPGAAWSGGHADMPVYPHAGGLGVVAIGTDTPGTSTDNPGAGALIFGHELVHDYDVKHTDVSGDCGSDDDTSDFPYTSASIQEFGFNTTTGKVYDPSNTHDLMSYCPAGGSRQGWISPFTWSRMYNNLAPSGVAVAAPAPAALGPALVVNAAIDNPTVAGGASAFGTLYRVEADVPTTPPPPGDYAIVLKDSIGGELARVPFAVSFESEYSAPGTQAHSHSPFDPPHVHGALDPGVGDPAETPLAWVSLTIPWADGTTQIVLEKGGQVLDTRSVSANPPAVQVASPNAPAVWPAGSTQTISWSATDPDGGALSYALFYAADGVSWELLAEGITGTSYQVPVDALRRLTSVRRVLKGSPARPTRFRWTRWPAARRPGSAWWRVTA